VSKNLVIIPTYNERENVVAMIKAVHSLPVKFDILIVDDGSPDGTAELVKEQQKYFKDTLHLYQRSGKLGLGTAYIFGFNWGIERRYDYIFEMDCDFSHNPLDLVRLHEVLNNNQTDVVVGSRYVNGGNCVNWPMDRKVLSYGASYYVRFITWMWVMDPTAGFVGYKRKVLETIDLNRIKFIGYAFQIEMKFASYLLGFKIKEIPITFTDRIEGSSKMSKSIVREAIFGVLQMRCISFYKSFRKEAVHLENPISEEAQTSNS
jgi:dolichol-phosphate mannosyltransferase